jgi:UDP-3-O-[3-hydroxymyristoyl] glucosamine N-acyltransferase
LSGEFEVVGFLEGALSAGKSLLNVAVPGPMVNMDHHRAASDQVIVPIDNNTVRERLMQQLAHPGFVHATVVHPNTEVSPIVVFGAGSAVMAGAIVGTEARLGVSSIVNCSAVVDHHATVEDFGHLGVNASMAVGTVLGRGAWMQAGAALGYGVGGW